MSCAYVRVGRGSDIYTCFRTYTHPGHMHSSVHTVYSGKNPFRAFPGGASPLRVFRGMGLKKGENGSNTRGGGCEPSRHQASPPLCSLESFVATGESQAVGTYKERVTLRSRRYTLKFVLRSLRSRRYTFKNFSARCARGGTPSKNFPLATLAEVHLKIFPARFARGGTP